MKFKIFSIALVALFLGQACSSTYGDYDDHKSGFLKRKPGVAPVNNALYKDECGSCHFAYQPGLLPEQSWKKIMSGLNDHFGDNAELDANIKEQLQAYLVSNSADKADYRRSKKIMRSLKKAKSKDRAPLRITDIRYIKRKHHEVPKRLIAGNDKVGSLSHCDACHQTVASGSFSERKIRIPGYGRWDD